MSEFTKEDILSILRSFDPYDFEMFVSDLWKIQGWETEVTHGSGDLGIDVIATRSFPYNTEAHIQAKRYGPDSRVSGPEMQKYTSLTQRRGVDLVIVITTNSFTQQAASLADEFDIKMIDGSTLVDLIVSLDAEDLLIDYLASDDPSELSSNQIETTYNIDQIQSSSTQAPETLEPSSTASAGDRLRIELVGVSAVDGYIGRNSPTDRINGLVLAFEIANISNENWNIMTHNTSNDLGFTIYDKSGFGHTATWIPATFLRGKSVGNGWTWDENMVRPQSRVRLLGYWNVSHDTQIMTIEYEEEIYLGTDNFDYLEDSPSPEFLRIRLSEAARNVVGNIPKEVRDTIQ